MVTAQGEGLVLLLSLPRSGSTLLSLLLGAHSALECPPEPWLLLRLSSFADARAAQAPFDDDLAWIGARAFLDEATLTAATRAFATAAYNTHLERSAKRILIDKTPRYYHCLAFIDALFPRARKVFLTRNPLDVALSYRTAWEIDVEQASPERSIPTWCDFALGLFALADYFAAPAPEKYVLRYESLVRSPHQELERLSEFIGVEFEMAMLAYAEDAERMNRFAASTVGDRRALESHAVHRRSIGGWCSGLSAATQQKLIDLIGGDIFRRLGYADALERIGALGVRLPDEEDAAARRRRGLETIAERAAEVRQLRTALEASETDRAARLEVIEHLQRQIETSEADRAAHGATIETLRAELEAGERERARQGELIRAQRDDLERFPVRLLRTLGLV